VAQHQLTPPAVNFPDKRRTSSAANGNKNVTTPANFASNNDLDAALTAANGTYYTAARLDKMTQNDKVHALRLIQESGSI
jgi:hypothetical protein